MKLECCLSSLGYHKKTILRDVSFSLGDGQMLAIVGKNGSGKSTLLTALGGLLPYEGTVRVGGRELRSLSPRERATLVSLMAQLEASGCTDRVSLPYHKALIEGKLPYTVGGGIGQSRMCMFFLRKAHIGEVQSSHWSEEEIKICEANGVHLL